MARPLSSRKADALYLVFFCLHIPIMFFMDFSSLYPAALVPYTFRDYFVKTYADRCFIEPPLWFMVFLAGEVVYHLPISVWFVANIPHDHPLVPLNLLIFALETGVTTMVCVADVVEWKGYSEPQRTSLLGLYVPYLILSIVMGVDAFIRVKQQVLSSGAKGKTS